MFTILTIFSSFFTPPLLLDNRCFVFTSEQSLEFAWKIFFTDQCLFLKPWRIFLQCMCLGMRIFSLFWNPSKLHSPLTCLADKNCTSWKFSFFIHISKFFFVSAFVLLTISPLPSNFSFHVQHFTYTTEQNLKPLYLYEIVLNRECRFAKSLLFFFCLF